MFLALANSAAMPALAGAGFFRAGWPSRRGGSCSYTHPSPSPRRLVEVMTNVQAQTTSCASPVMQAGAEGALLGLQSVVEGLRLSIQNNRDIVMRELSSFNGVKTYRPDGTFYVLPDRRPNGRSAAGLMAPVVAEARVAAQSAS